MSSIYEIIDKKAIAAAAKKDEHESKMEELAPKVAKLLVESGHTVVTVFTNSLTIITLQRHIFTLYFWWCTKR